MQHDENAQPTGPQPYYQDDAVTIYNGDCRDIAPSLPPESVDLLLTDPPYGMAFISGWTLEKATVKSDGVRQGVRVVRSALNELAPTFAADMHALVFCHWESWPDFYDNLCHLFPIRNALVWSKTGGGWAIFGMSMRRITRSFCSAHGRGAANFVVSEPAPYSTAIAACQPPIALCHLRSPFRYSPNSSSATVRPMAWFWTRSSALARPSWRPSRQGDERLALS